MNTRTTLVTWLWRHFRLKVKVGARGLSRVSTERSWLIEYEYDYNYYISHVTVTSLPVEIQCCARCLSCISKERSWLIEYRYEYNVHISHVSMTSLPLVRSNGKFSSSLECTDTRFTAWNYFAFLPFLFISPELEIVQVFSWLPILRTSLLQRSDIRQHTYKMKVCKIQFLSHFLCSHGHTWWRGPHWQHVSKKVVLHSNLSWHQSFKPLSSLVLNVLLIC